MAKNNNKPTYPLLIIDFLAFAILGICVLFVEMKIITLHLNQSESLLSMIAIPLFVFLTICAGLYLYAEYKINRLKLRNIFLYFAFIIALANIIAVAVLPNEVILPNDAEPLIISPMMRVYYLLSGFAFGLMPYFCFYVAPRKILNRRYMNIVLYIILGLACLFIILSPMVEWRSYMSDKISLQSVCGHKNVFARMLLFGIFAAILLRIKKKDARWILFLIPFYIFTILTNSKIGIVVATLTVLTYFVIRLVMICKKSKDNLIITLLIVGFVLLLSPLFIVGIVRSDSGMLFFIKKFFIDMGKSAEATFGSRLIIWRSAFDLLKPYQYIFGFGINTFGPALHNAYAQVAPGWDVPNLPYIYHAHNIIVEFIGRGGIILLGIYVFLYAYLVYVSLKLRKKTPWLSTATIIFLFMSLLIGMVEPTYICGLDENLLMNFVIIFPIMSEYYLLMDKDEREIREDMVKQSKTIKNVKFKSKLLTLNKKRLIHEAKYIAYDLNSKIRL